MAAIDLGLDGRPVLVTGASHSELAEAADIRGAILLQGDFPAMPDARRVVAEALAALDGLGVLVNNAGHVLGRIPLVDMDDAAIDRIFDLNTRSVVAACRAALPALAASQGCIVNVTSISARSGGSPRSALYSGI